MSSASRLPEATKSALGSLFPVFEKAGETLQLRVSAFDRDGAYLGSTPVEWQSSDLGVATVDAAGLVTVHSSGSFVISATTREIDPKLSASLPLRSVIVGAVRIGQKHDDKDTEPEALKLALGETVSMRADVLNDRDEVIADAKVRWRSAGYAVSITPDGEAEGRAIGDAQLVAEAKGKMARVDVHVVDWPKTRRTR